MRDTLKVEEDRLFKPFLDPVDMVGCFPAGATLEEINRLASGHGLRFPLVCDPGQSLPAHLEVTEWSPASARFGPFIDNVLGMNWELPSSRLVQVGERVVKSTTGYDLTRFLLHADRRFGRARDFVLRLRPIGGETLYGRFNGGPHQLRSLQYQLISHSWIHWIDRADLVLVEGRPEVIEVAGDCIQGEAACFTGWFQEISEAAGTAFTMMKDLPPAGLPAFSVKVLRSRAPGTARRIVAEWGGQARVLLVNGCILAQPERDPDPAWLAELAAEAGETGGHVFGRSHQVTEPCRVEKDWMDYLEEAWRRL